MLSKLAQLMSPLALANSYEIHFSPLPPISPSILLSLFIQDTMIYLQTFHSQRLLFLN